MLFLVIEQVRDGDLAPAYARVAAEGPRAPPGPTYVSSWVTTDLRRRYRVTECDDRQLLDRWMARWRDLVDCEVRPVLTVAVAQDTLSAPHDAH